MKQKQIQVMNLDKTIDESSNIMSCDVVAKCIKKGYHLTKEDFFKLKDLYERNSYMTYKKTEEIITDKGNTYYKILQVQELSTKRINELCGASPEIHFFGEMDLDLSKTPLEIYTKAFDIAEQCGYMADMKEQGSKAMVILYGREGEEFRLGFKDNKIDLICDKTRGVSNQFTPDKIPNYIGYAGGFY